MKSDITPQKSANLRAVGYKLVRSDRRAGGEFQWPDQDRVLAETELSDGYRGGITPGGILAIAERANDLAVTSGVGGSALLTMAYNPEDVAGVRDGGLVTRSGSRSGSCPRSAGSTRASSRLRL